MTQYKPQESLRFDLITWENCSLRKWLNSTFMEAAFDLYGLICQGYKRLSEKKAL